MPPDSLEPESITIRPLREDDVAAVELLAELEQRPVPQGQLLLVEVDGTIEAAIGLESGETVADPASKSTGALTLLRVRAVQLRAT